MDVKRRSDDYVDSKVLEMQLLEKRKQRRSKFQCEVFGCSEGGHAGRS